MRISKIDTLRIDAIRIQDHNPLSTVECGLDVIFLDNQVPREAGKPVSLEQGDIAQAIVSLFTGKYVNRGELFPLALLDGKLVCKISITNFEALKHATPQSYGLVDENTIFRFKVNQKSQGSVKVNSNEAKQLFKEDISFQELGIGGLDEQFAKIFRRAFNSRRYP